MLLSNSLFFGIFWKLFSKLFFKLFCELFWKLFALLKFWLIKFTLFNGCDKTLTKLLKIKRKTVWLLRKRISVFAGCTLTSTSCGDNVKNKQTLGCFDKCKTSWYASFTAWFKILSLTNRPFTKKYDCDETAKALAIVGFIILPTKFKSSKFALTSLLFSKKSFPKISKIRSLVVLWLLLLKSKIIFWLCINLKLICG